MIKKPSYIAISAIWYERFLECSRTHGTDGFPGSVWRFYHSLLNLGADNLAIKKQVDDYILNVWQPELEKKLEIEYRKTKSQTTGIKQFIRKFVEQEHITNLFSFMIQIIQDSGIGWPTQDEMQNYMISQE